MQFCSDNSVSPSFTGHTSSNNLADIAARVVEEFRKENGHDEDDDIYNFVVDDDEDVQVYVGAEDEISRSEGNCTEDLKVIEEENEEEEFEFDVICANANSSPVSADEIFSNGEIMIMPRYPLFDRSLLLDDAVDKSEGNSKPEVNHVISPVIRHPLRKLFREERDSATVSSPEVDNFDGISPETYCIWKPKVDSPEKCTKSNSTGNSTGNTSKRWRLRNLLQRSNSDSNMAAGEVFGPLTAMKKRSEKVKKAEKTTAKVAGAEDDGELTPVTDRINSANRTAKRGNRIRSYLWYEKAQ